MRTEYSGRSGRIVHTPYTSTDVIRCAKAVLPARQTHQAVASTKQIFTAGDCDEPRWRGGPERLNQVQQKAAGKHITRCQ